MNIKNSNNNSGDTNMYFVEMNDKGVLKMAKTITGATTKNNVAYSIHNTLDNNFILFGYIDSIPGSAATTTHTNEILFEVDTTGATKWIQYFYSSNFTAIGKDAIELPDGYYFTVGTMLLFGSYAMHIQYLGPGGWWQDGLAFEGTQNEQGNSIAYHNRDNFAFAGSTTFGAGDMDAYLVRFTYDSLAVTYKLSQRNYKDTSVCYLGIPSASVIPPGVKLFPNPVSSGATILVQGDIGEHYSFNVYNESGQLVIESPLTLASHGQSIGHIEKGSLSAGMYFYGIANKEGDRVAAGKFIIE